METFILKLVIAIIPLVVLIASVTIFSKLYSWYTHHPLDWHRTRHSILRTLASGVMLR